MGKYFKDSKLGRSQKGTSLIELILYFALLGIILIIATDIMLQTSEFSLKSGAKNVVQEDARFIKDRLTYDISRADSISTPANLGDSSSTLVLIIGTEIHTYTLSIPNLEYQKETGPPAITTIANINSNQTKVNTLNFQRLGNAAGKPTVKITFGIEAVRSAKGEPKTKTFETVVGAR